MSTVPGSSRLVRGGLAPLDRNAGSIRRVITLRYHFDSVSRTLPVQGGRGAVAPGAVSESGRLR